MIFLKWNTQIVFALLLYFGLSFYFHYKKYSIFKFIHTLLVPCLLYPLFYYMSVTLYLKETDGNFLTQFKSIRVALFLDYSFMFILVLICLFVYRITQSYLISSLSFFSLQFLFILIHGIDYSTSKFFPDGAVSFFMILDYLKDIFAMTQSGAGLLHYKEFILLFILPFLLLTVSIYGVIRLKKTTISPKEVYWSFLFYLVICFLFHHLATKIQTSSTEMGQSNVVFRFFETYQKTKKLKNSYSSVHRLHQNRDEIVQKYQALYSQFHYVDPEYPLIRKAKSLPKLEILPEGMKPNIVIILMESVAFKETALNTNTEHLPGKNVTPFLNQLMEKSFVVNHFFSNAEYTAGAMLSLFFGLHDSLRYIAENSSVFRNIPNLKMESFAKILRNHSYHTTLFMGFHAKFDNEDIVFSRNGFEHIHDFKTLKKEGDPVLYWGLPDELMLLRGAEKLDSISSPFLAFFLTNTNHAPFELPPDTITITSGETPYEKYLNTVHYTDQSLKKFFEVIEKKSWYSKTIFVITSDNGVPLSDQKHLSEMQVEMMRHRVPFLLFSPNPEITSKWLKKDYETIASHVDIAPTLLHLMGIEVNTPFMGESIFDPNRNQFALFYTWFNRFFLVQDQKVYSKQTHTIFDWNSMKSIEQPELLEPFLNRLQITLEMIHYLVINKKIWSEDFSSKE